MIRKEFVLPPELPVSRMLAAQLVQLTAKYESRIMIETGQKVVNGKSLLGLLSLYNELDKPLQLTVDGQDEEVAAEAVLAFVGAK